MAVKYTPPEGWKPPKQAGTKTEIGKGNRPAPQKEGESDEDFKARSARWMNSYNARGGVKIADMNQGQLNKFAASGGPRRSEMMTSRIGQYMEKHKGDSTTPPPGSPDMSAENPSAPKPPKPPTTPRDPREPRGASAGMTAGGGSAQSTGGFGGNLGAAGSSLARMPGRRARRRARRIAGRA